MIVDIVGSTGRFRTRLARALFPRNRIALHILPPLNDRDGTRQILSGAASANVQQFSLGKVIVTIMRRRIRHCVECPKCQTRYLVGASPYGNGSYLISCLTKDSEVHILYCACDRSAISNPWRELKKYAVSSRAQDRGYGPPEEIVLVGT